MKPIKMFGLAALAALVAMALVGVSSAMATSTALCKNDENPCGGANQVPHVHEETLPGDKAKILTDIWTIECDVLFLGTVLGLGKPQVIHGNFTYTNCLRGLEKCEVKQKPLTEPLLEVLRTVDELATVTESFEIEAKCNLIIKCTISGLGLKGHGLGALTSSEKNGETRFEEQEIDIKGMLCPLLAKLDILTTPLEPTYIKQ